jgi:uncharacterized membrane protein YidH (DUF202 family)
MTHDTYRRLYGMTLGAALGLAFGLTSQTLNALVIPDVIFHQPPLGLSGNLVSSVLIGGSIGLVSSWLASSFSSVLIAAVLGSIGLELVGSFYGTVTPADQVGNLLFTLLILLLPMTGLLAAVFGLLRWIVNKQVEQRRDHISLLRRSWLPATAIMIMGVIGATALYPAEGQQRIKEMNSFVQAGLRATNAADWPPALTKYAEMFRQRATPQYTLQWIRGDGLLRWRIGQPAGFQPWQYSIVAARFDTGWALACLFMPDNSTPHCQAYDRDPSLNYPDNSD